MEKAVFGGGCFWCTEAIFQSLKGVSNVEPGYAGGTTANPTYENIGDYAESIQIEFDPKKVSYQDLLTVFFATHDPTTINQQGADVGEQYRSVILYANNEQRDQAEKFIEELNKSSEFGKPVVTEVNPLKEFYSAEDYHKNYYEQNKDNRYCQMVINPKLKKVKEKFAQLVR